MKSNSKINSLCAEAAFNRVKALCLVQGYSVVPYRPDVCIRRVISIRERRTDEELYEERHPGVVYSGLSDAYRARDKLFREVVVAFLNALPGETQGK